MDITGRSRTPADAVGLRNSRFVLTDVHRLESEDAECLDAKTEASPKWASGCRICPVAMILRIGSNPYPCRMSEKLITTQPHHTLPAWAVSTRPSSHAEAQYKGDRNLEKGRLGFEVPIKESRGGTRGKRLKAHHLPRRRLLMLQTSLGGMQISEEITPKTASALSPSIICRSGTTSKRRTSLSLFRAPSGTAKNHACGYSSQSQRNPADLAPSYLPVVSNSACLKLQKSSATGE